MQCCTVLYCAPMRKGVAPTEAACTNTGCCPNECLGQKANVRAKMCTNCKCAGCAPALFGNNCKGLDIPDKCGA